MTTTTKRGKAYETHQTVYSVQLSAIVTLQGRPEHHTQRAIFENVLSLLEAAGSDGGGDFIDKATVLEINKEKP